MGAPWYKGKDILKGQPNLEDVERILEHIGSCARISRSKPKGPALRNAERKHRSTKGQFKKNRKRMKWGEGRGPLKWLLQYGAETPAWKKNELSGEWATSTVEIPKEMLYRLDWGKGPPGTTEWAILIKKFKICIEYCVKKGPIMIQ